MSESTRTSLRDLLIQRYEDLKTRLTWRFGSAELASDALQDTWLRLQGRDEATPVSHPIAYLTRMVTNIALDRLHRDRHYMSAEELQNFLLQIVDQAPGPAQQAEAEDDLQALSKLIDSLPPRRRAILLAVRVEALSNQEVAARFRVSERLVGLELKRAHEYFMAHMPQKK